jgi:hypothetical protein
MLGTLAGISRKYVPILPLAALLAILMVRSECNDCRVFRTGAILVGNGMYDPAAQAALQPGEPLLPFFRAPFYGLLLKPLLLFDFRTAWRVLNALAALLFFGLTQHLTGDRLTPLWALACPLFWVNFAIGQDAAIMAAVIIGSMVLWRSGQKFSAGALLALTLQKPTLFLLLPLAVWKGGRKMVAGYLVGATVLLGISFAVVGPGAVGDYFRLLQAYREGPLMMPTIRGFFAFVGAPGAWIWVAAIATVVMGAVIWRKPFLDAASLATACSLLISPFSFQHDLALLVLPVCLAPGRLVLLRVVAGVQILLVVLLKPAHAVFFNGILAVVFCVVLAVGLRKKENLSQVTRETLYHEDRT